MRRLRRIAVTLVVIAAPGCGAAKPDYGAFFAKQPRSILVVPPLNETTEVTAPAVYSTTVTQPLAERGYYVFPVILTEELLKDLGLPEAGLVHQVPPSRFQELFGADAVLFVKIKDWSNRYLVLNHTTTVEVELTLKDTRTGTVLWERTQAFAQTRGGNVVGTDGLAGLIAAVVVTAVQYAVSEMAEVDYRPLAVQANQLAFAIPGVGLPAGPYHPEHRSDLEAYH
jgi:hypothetical protein